jgi:hypothetical protein
MHEPKFISAFILPGRPCAIKGGKFGAKAPPAETIFL